MGRADSPSSALLFPISFERQDEPGWPLTMWSCSPQRVIRYFW